MAAEPPGMLVSATLLDRQTKLTERVRNLDTHLEKLLLFFNTFKSTLPFSCETLEAVLLSYNLDSHSLSLTQDELDHWGSYSLYRHALQLIHDEKIRFLTIYVDHIQEFFVENGENEQDAEVYEGLITNTPRYLELLYEAAEKSLLSGDYENSKKSQTTIQRPAAISSAEVYRYKKFVSGAVPSYLRVNFQIILIPGSKLPTRKLRLVNADMIGKLCKLEAEVTRVTQVKPRIQIATYECQKCHQSTFQSVEGHQFMPIFDCMQCCANDNATATLKFSLSASKFVKYQEIRVQEPAVQIPDGDVPRTLNCIVLGEHTRQLKPGMSVTLTGTLLPIAKFGFAATRSGLIADKSFEVHYVENNKRNFDQNDEDYIKLQEKIRQLRQEGGLYERLADSIAPEIWGHEDVKKALLLQLIGGCTRHKPDGGTIRGEIHILLMGDPGVAKSQLMKKVCSIAQRSVYTTGKGSSSVGLTAAVVKDPNTNETSLEGGALVLADQGICCIDEFDKMDEYDRSAIYEVMEQQSVSISKSGHCTSLPARTSVIAAANPASGKYDPEKSPMANMNLPAALITRFDMQFLILGTADREKDINLAKHVLQIYRGTSNTTKNTPRVVDRKVLRAFINLAKLRKPSLSREKVREISEWYVATRQQEQLYRFPNTTYTTPRALLAILRLSQALARLRDSDTIEIGDFEEASRLMTESKRAALEKGAALRSKKKADPVTEVMDILRRLKGRLSSQSFWDGWIQLEDIQNQVVSQGLKFNDVQRAIDLYSELSVIIVNETNNALAFPEDIN